MIAFDIIFRNYFKFYFLFFFLRQESESLDGITCLPTSMALRCIVAESKTNNEENISIKYCNQSRNMQARSDLSLVNAGKLHYGHIRYYFLSFLFPTK